MRKAVIMLILLGAVSLPSAGRSFEELMESYGPNKGVVTVAMSESVLQRMAGRDDNDLLRKLSKLMIISVTAPEEDTLRNAFLADAEEEGELPVIDVEQLQPIVAVRIGEPIIFPGVRRVIGDTEPRVPILFLKKGDAHRIFSPTFCVIITHWKAQVKRIV